MDHAESDLRHVPVVAREFDRRMREEDVLRSAPHRRPLHDALDEDQRAFVPGARNAGWREDVRVLPDGDLRNSCPKREVAPERQNHVDVLLVCDLRQLPLLPEPTRAPVQQLREMDDFDVVRISELGDLGVRAVEDDPGLRASQGHAVREVLDDGDAATHHGTHGADENRQGPRFEGRRFVSRHGLSLSSQLTRIESLKSNSGPSTASRIAA